MGVLQQMSDGFALADLDDRHLERWREVGTASEQHLAIIHQLNPEWLAWKRAERGPEPWEVATRTEEGNGRWHEVAMIDKDDDLVGAIILIARSCPAEVDALAFELHYALHPDIIGKRRAPELIRTLSTWTDVSTGRSHLFGAICTLNAASLGAARSAGMEEVSRVDYCDADSRLHEPHCEGKQVYMCLASSPHP